MSKARNKSKGFLLLPGIIVAILLCIWVYSTAFHAFDDDEFQHANIAWLMDQGQRPYADFFEHHLVLYHGLTAPMFRVHEGRSMIFAFRTLSLIAAAASLLLIYSSGRKLGASPAAATAGVWLLALTPMFVLKMTEARPEVPAMLAFAAGVWLTADTCSKDEEKGLIRSFIHRYWKSAAVGFFAALIALFSQKYGMVSIALVAAAAMGEMKKVGERESGVGKYLKSGFHHLIAAVTAFLLVMVSYWGWMMFLGIAEETIEKTVWLNLRWQYTFSPLIYISEMYLTAGVLTATGLLGVGVAAFKGRRGAAWVIAILLAGAVGLILLVPVPHRQSFLPLLIVLSLGTMFFLTPVFEFVFAISGKPRVWIAVIFLLLGSGSIRVLPDHLSADNRDDLERMSAIEQYAPKGPIFDGRRLMFWRPHIGSHPFMHEEVLLMIDDEAYAEEVIDGLQDAGLPPVIWDYRVEIMPEEIKVFIEERYQKVDIEDVYGAVVRRDRLMPGRSNRITIPAEGHWRISWEGEEEMKLDGTSLRSGESVFLNAEKHDFKADGLVWDLRIERDYGGE